MQVSHMYDSSLTVCLQTKRILIYELPFNSSRHKPTGLLCIEQVLEQKFAYDSWCLITVVIRGVRRGGGDVGVRTPPQLRSSLLFHSA